MKRGDRTRAEILDRTVELLAVGGPSHVSLRRLGQDVHLVQSAVYHHFSNKDALLEATFAHIGRTLGARRAQLPPVPTTYDLLVQRIEFQFDQAPLIVAVLKYFVDRRDRFPQLANSGFIPPAGYKHIVEVIERGNQAGDWVITDPAPEAKVVVHAINGFILEYYPAVPSPEHRAQLVQSIARFIWRSLSNPA
jgi:AcrR family transcriptional regulator